MHPDPLVVLVSALKADAGVLAVTDRVGTRTPPELSRAFARLTLLDERASGPALHNVDALVQIDCYGSSSETSSQAEASELARAVRAALFDLPSPTPVEGAIVSSVQNVGIARIPDSTIDPPRERYLVTASVYLHPAP